MTALATTDITTLPLFRRGKVRDTYNLGDETLLMIATDRISAFDVVMPTPIPDKGVYLTQMSKWWFGKSAHVAPNHLLADVLPGGVDPALQGRAMHVKKAERIDIECVVRGYLAGSGWKEYQESGTLAGEKLPDGLKSAAKLPELRFTPALKNDEGHDENISRAKLADTVGTDLAHQLEDASLRLFQLCSDVCAEAGLILVDTKFEFGFVEGQLIVIDEMITPDSSRFWEKSSWQEGSPVTAFDKQFLRDWLEGLTWNKQAPGPELPTEIVDQIRALYATAAQRICGITL